MMIFLEKILEAIYFSVFLITGKRIKEKKILFICLMIFEYLILKSIIKFNVAFQFSYTFLTFVILKILYKDKAQITDLFLFAAASVVLIFISVFSYFIILFTIKKYIVALILNRILLFLFLYINRNNIREKYKEFCPLWNRHNNPNKPKSLTLRNMSVISFNLMFWVINLGMIYFITFLK